MSKLEDQFLAMVSAARSQALLADHYWQCGMTVQARDLLHMAQVNARRMLMVASASPSLAQKYQAEERAMNYLLQGVLVGKDGVYQSP